MAHAGWIRLTRADNDKEIVVMINEIKGWMDSIDGGCYIWTEWKEIDRVRVKQNSEAIVKVIKEVASD